MQSFIQRARLELPPEKLYRYRSIDKSGRTEHIFKNSELYFASPLSLNDPFDCKFRVVFEGSRDTKRRFLLKMINQQAQRGRHVSRKKRDEIVERGLSGFYGPGNDHHEIIDEQEFVSDILAQQSLLCLTEKPDDILMWSHYADSHRGVCLEFMMRGAPRMGILRHANYGDQIPKVNLLKPLQDIGFRILLTKARHWAYEVEWRSVVKKPAHQHPFSPEALTGVILGCQITPRDEQAVRNWTRRRDPVPKLYRAKKKTDEFGLRIVEEPLGSQ